MFRNLGLAGAALALFLMAGGQWAVLQTAAWANMLRDYHRQSGSVAVAIEQTFDGQHPCELCRAIASAKAREQADKGNNTAAPALKDAAKVKARLADTAFRPRELAAAAILLPQSGAPRVSTRNEPPPVPPPRRVA